MLIQRYSNFGTNHLAASFDPKTGEPKGEYVRSEDYDKLAAYAEELERFALGVLRHAVLPLAWLCDEEPESKCRRAVYDEVSRAIELIKEGMAKQGRPELRPEGGV